MKRNTRKRTPIPGLAEHIAQFSATPTRKQIKTATAAILAHLADRIYSLSLPKRRERIR